MKLHSSMEVRGKLLLVVVSGEGSFNETWDLLKQTYDAALEERVNLILIDTLAAEGKLTTFDRYQLGTETVEYIRSRQMNPRIALVGKPPAADGFGVLVAKNRWVTAEMFPSRQEALNWLGLGKTEP
jgi:hypothetical protein